MKRKGKRSRNMMSIKAETVTPGIGVTHTRAAAGKRKGRAASEENRTVVEMGPKTRAGVEGRAPAE